MNVDFSQELETFKNELTTTEEELQALQTRLSQLPDVSQMKAQLLYLKGKKSRPVVIQKQPEIKKVSGEKRTRRKKPEMLAFKSDVKQAIKVVGRGGKTFSAKNVLNTIKTQGHKGDASDAQIVRQVLNQGVKDDWLASESRGKYKIA